MPEYIVHVSADGDRWDQLSAQYYDDPYGYERLIAANPHLPIVPVLAAGWEVRVPLLEDTEAELLDDELLPPWKRSSP